MSELPEAPLRLKIESEKRELSILYKRDIENQSQTRRRSQLAQTQYPRIPNHST